MTKVFVSQQAVDGGQVYLSGDDARHLGLVLRKKPGDKVVICIDGQSFVGRIEHVEAECVRVSLHQSMGSNQESPIHIRLYQGLAKGDKFELVIQKATELGVNEIIPYTSKHTVVKLDQKRKKSRLTRWQKIANEAGKQCKRDQIPVITDLLDFSSVIKQLSSGNRDTLVLMPYEQASEEKKLPLDKSPMEVAILIGPEGGFHADEVEAVKQIGGQIISLGPRILRTETAGLITVAIVQFLWGDLGVSKGLKLE